MSRALNFIQDKRVFCTYEPISVVYTGRYFYCTMNITGPHKWVIDMGYSCDCGHVFAGRIIRYRFGDNGRITGFDDITPLLQANDDGNTFERISNDEQNFGLIQSIDGDSRVYGRFVIATGSFGLKIGKPC